MTLEYLMRQNGVDPSTDATVDTTVQFNSMAGAFTGRCDLFEPTTTEVEQAGKGYILASIGQESGEIPLSAHIPQPGGDPEEAPACVDDAMALAQQWVAEHTDRQVAEAICDRFRTRTWTFWSRVCAGNGHRRLEPHPGDGAAGPGAAGDGHQAGS